MSMPAASRRPVLFTAIAGLLAGAFDITFAFIFYGMHGATPARILAGIASGLVGSSAAHAMGGWSVLLGALLHFFAALCAAFVYLFLSRGFPLLILRPLLSGAVFGVGMYVVMHFVVIPLSHFPFFLPSMSGLIGELCSHIFLFGMVIALGVARGSRAEGSASEAAGCVPETRH
jgi:hypothetical protein